MLPNQELLNGNLVDLEQQITIREQTNPRYDKEQYLTLGYTSKPQLNFVIETLAKAGPVKGECNSNNYIEDFDLELEKQSTGE